MPDLFPKFIIQGDGLILGMVSFHSELVDKEEPGKVKGGGWFRWNSDRTMITFHGDSHDFGAVSVEDIKACIAAGNIFGGFYGHPLRNHEVIGYAYRVGSDITILKESN